MSRFIRVTVLVAGLCLVGFPVSAQESGPDDEGTESSSEASDQQDGEGQKIDEGSSSSSEGGASDGEGEKAASEPSESMSFKNLAKKGMEFYKAEKWNDAVAYFKQAYEKRHNPSMLYNIARSYEHMGETEKAIEYYTKYAQNPEVATEDRKGALDRVEALREIQSLSEEEQEKKTRSKADEGKPAGKEVTAQTDTGEAQSGGGNTAGWIVLGSGGALAAGGAIFGVLANAQRIRLKEATTLGDLQDAQEKGEIYALVADSLYAGAIVAGGIGTVLLVTGSNSSGQAGEKGGKENEEQALKIEFRPVISWSGAGLSVRGRF